MPERRTGPEYCPHCGDVFSFFEDLANHVRHKHGLVLRRHFNNVGVKLGRPPKTTIPADASRVS